MRRAILQPRFTQIELVDGRFWGVPSEQTYDPFDLYERGAAPHLIFANAKDPLEWHKAYGPLFGFTSAYSSSAHAFVGAQRRFVSVLDLWQAVRGNRWEIRECFPRAVAETGCLVLPGQIAYELNPEWNAEARGETLDEIIVRPIENSLTIDGKNYHAAAEEFAGSASRKDLRSAAEELLKFILTARLRDVQPAFRDEKGFEATWAVRDFLEACYLMLFYDITGKKTIRHCAECSQFFYPVSKRPRFCSADCARKNRQRRYWKRRGKFTRRKHRNRPTEIGGEQT